MSNKDLPNEISKDEVWNVIEYANSLYSGLKGYNMPYISDFYDAQQDNKLLVDLNNNPQIPTLDNLKSAIANFKNSSEQLQGYSEFMLMWDGIYKSVIDYYLNLLSFDIDKYCINIKDNSEYSSQAYKDDCKRVAKFFENFGAKEQFRIVVKNMLVSDAYFCWLRDSYGSYDEEAIDLKEKKEQSFTLQMMPQKYCKITGEFTTKDLKGKGLLWDFNLDYFNNANVNILNYDPSLINAFKNEKEEERLKNFIIDNNTELNDTNSYYRNHYVRTKVNKGAWCFKKNLDTFNIVPPFAYLLKSVFTDDLIEKLQRDKDIISANAIILGEMKTRDKENVGNNKNAFTIDPKQVGTLMKLARNGINKNIKQIALPLEETRLYQFADNNSNMYDKALSTNAGLSSHNSEIVYSSDKMSQEQAQIASSIDFHSIADDVYPQFESFLNFFVNKKTKKYKFRFKVSGSTLPFLRQKDIDNHIKFMDKGINIPISRIGSLLGYEGNEFEQMVKEAKFGDMQDNLFLLMNTNTSSFGTNSQEQGGRPKQDISDLSQSGATSREYQ